MKRAQSISKDPIKRITIAILAINGRSGTDIARIVGMSQSAVYKELRRKEHQMLRVQIAGYIKELHNRDQKICDMFDNAVFNLYNKEDILNVE